MHGSCSDANLSSSECASTVLIGQGRGLFPHGRGALLHKKCSPGQTIRWRSTFLNWIPRPSSQESNGATSVVIRTIPPHGQQFSFLHRRSPAGLISSPLLQSGKGSFKRMKPCQAASAGTQGQGRGISQLAATRKLGKPLTARGAEPLSRQVSIRKRPGPGRRIRGRDVPQGARRRNGRHGTA